MRTNNFGSLVSYFRTAFIAVVFVSIFCAVSFSASVNKLVVNVDKPGDVINRNIYGHFAEHLGGCIYGGFWVGKDSPIPNTRGIRNDIVMALKELDIPVLRWPGGCFADMYHWMDGVGPQEKRKPILNTFWGNVYEDNSFGTHEFMDLCEQLECEVYIAGNVGSGTVQEMQQWVEYMTFEGKSPMAELRKANGREQPWKVKYWGVGNENWGCGGNFRPEHYADIYRQFATYLRNYSGNNLYKVACGNYADRDNCSWTDAVMRIAARKMHGLSIHYYCGSGKKKKLAAQFDKEDWFFQMKRALRMDEVIEKNLAVMDKYDPEKKVDLLVDEWGTWHKTEPGTKREFLFQQNTLHDALVAGLTLNIFNNRCDRVKMANIAQTVNVLQAMILTQDEKMVLTPTYYVFEMYKVHQDATLLPTQLESADYAFGDEKIKALNVSASRDKAGKIHISICNLDPVNQARLDCVLAGFKPRIVSGRILTHDDINAHNTFDKTDAIKTAEFTGAQIRDGNLEITMPAKSIVVLQIQ